MSSPNKRHCTFEKKITSLPKLNLVYSRRDKQQFPHMMIISSKNHTSAKISVAKVRDSFILKSKKLNRKDSRLHLFWRVVLKRVFPIAFFCFVFIYLRRQSAYCCFVGLLFHYGIRCQSHLVARQGTTFGFSKLDPFPIP